MKIICRYKTIDLNKFEKVECRESIIGGDYGFPVEAIRKEQGKVFASMLVVVEDEILRFRDMDSARMLLDAITKDWIAGADCFDVERWVTATQMESRIMRDKGNYYEMVYRENREY